MQSIELGALYNTLNTPQTKWLNLNTVHWTVLSEHCTLHIEKYIDKHRWPVNEIDVALSLRPLGTLVKILRNINQNVTQNLNMFLANQTSKSFQTKKN